MPTEAAYGLSLMHRFDPSEKDTAPETFGKRLTRRLAVMNLANGSMSSNQSGEGDIRRALIEADLVDCMVALPGQLFYSTLFGKN